MSEPVFANRMQAGARLAAELTEYAGRPDAIVLALPRGGVPVGFALAKALSLPLDVLMVRKLGVPGYEEFAMGAITAGGARVLSDDVLRMTGVQSDAIEEAARREMDELRRREALYRNDRPMLDPEGRIVILADDGMATGSSMLAAVRAVRAQHPARVIVAVPVASPSACALVAAEADRVVCPWAPEWFRAVSPWYDDFSQTSNEEVLALLREAARERGLPAVPSVSSSATAQGTNGEKRHHEE